MAKKDDTLLDIDLGLTDEAPAAPVVPAQKYHKGKIEYAGPFYTVNIAHSEHDSPTASHDIQCNGEAIRLFKGEDVPNIPHAFVQILKTAVAARQVTKRDRDGKQYFEWQPYPAVPYQITEGPYATRKIPVVE